MRPGPTARLVLLVALCATADASEPQSLDALVDGTRFASDDDSILLVPVAGTFSLSAATAGASAYPAPKSPIDRLSIMCSGFVAGKTLKLDSKSFERSGCESSFARAAREPGRNADEYRLDKSSSATLFKITTASGKAIEGRFAFRMKNAQDKALTISEGRFKAEDREL